MIDAIRSGTALDHLGGGYARARDLVLEMRPCLACTRSPRRLFPSSQVATLTGHTLRVLYLAMSPDGQTIVTGAGDETLRFWNVFPGPKTKGDASDSSSMLDFQGRTSIR